MAMIRLQSPEFAVIDEHIGEKIVTRELVHAFADLIKDRERVSR